jgi:predicted AAA+ superfamily ATPase
LWSKIRTSEDNGAVCAYTLQFIVSDTCTTRYKTIIIDSPQLKLAVFARKIPDDCRLSEYLRRDELVEHLND